MDVSRSGFHSWMKVQSVCKNAEIDAKLLAAIQDAHQLGRRVCGARKIRTILADQEIKAGLRKVRRLRRENGIVCLQKKPFRVSTTDSKHDEPISPNLLNQTFNETTEPNQVWVTDITYIPTQEGWLYLAGVKDLHTCEIVGWSMDEVMNKELVMQALRAAYNNKRPAAGLIHHSDHGSQYCSSAYRGLLDAYGMRSSMSRKGNCYYNAPMESFWGALKNESLHHMELATREEAKAAVFDYIEIFYHAIRPHQKLNNLTPRKFVEMCDSKP